MVSGVFAQEMSFIPICGGQPSRSAAVRQMSVETPHGRGPALPGPVEDIPAHGNPARAGVCRRWLRGATLPPATPPGTLTGVCMGFSCRGMAGDLQVELGFRPGFGQQPDPAPEPAPEQQPPQPVNAVADYAAGPTRPAPTAVVSGRQVFRRRSQVAGSNPPVIGVFHPPVVAGGRLWSHRPGSATSPPPTPANAAKSAPGRFYGSYPISIPGS